ncbi:hypothetical protein GCM10025872_12630 [Barrientosiimonas endolithica]|uniref:Uncharacterized protein n=1 Tax=Barrientosiimonas endolithica TaxID=1535208 RepID=A0ABM8H9K2_9MICO|nr:hypothetical protein GCM10025872_12630 [Barrientosiimonas endolithica]
MAVGVLADPGDVERAGRGLARVGDHRAVDQHVGAAQLPAGDPSDLGELEGDHCFSREALDDGDGEDEGDDDGAVGAVIG